MSSQEDETTPTPRLSTDQIAAVLLELADTIEDDSSADLPIISVECHHSEAAWIRTAVSALRSHDALVEALQRVNHTLVVHGHMDAGTPLHEFILATLRHSGAGVE